MDRINNLSDFFLFVQVVDAGGFSAAAGRMNTTRSLLSRRIIGLEKRLGVRLLHRNARQFAITAVGEEVYRHAALMCAAAMAAEQAATAAGSPNGLVRIEAQGWLAAIVSGWLPDFATTHPRIRLRIGSGRTDVSALLRQQLDVVLAERMTLPDSTDIVARDLGEMRMVTVASVDYLERHGAPADPWQLQDGQCLALATHEATVPWSFSGRPTWRPRARMTCGDTAALLSAVRSGLGIAQMPLPLCQDDLTEGRLRTLLETHEAAPLSLHALTMSGRVVTEATLHLIRFVQQRFASLARQSVPDHDVARRA